MRISFKFILTVVLSFFTIHCASTGNKNTPSAAEDEIKKSILHTVRISKLNKVQIQKDIVRFKEIIEKKKALSANDWKLHDSLLEVYKQLKYRPRNGVISIRPKTVLIISLNSYCLDSLKAPPSENEVYSWRKDKSDFTYLKEILNLSHQDKYSQKMLQELIWNLNNKTAWENYPDEQKSILKTIDPQAAVKLPSQLKSELKDLALNHVASQIPESARNTVDIIKGQYYRYEDFKAALDSRQSKKTLPLDSVSLVEGTSLYTKNMSYGVSNQEVHFLNPSENSQFIDLNEYYQVPLRTDVQRLAAYFTEESWDSIFREFTLHRYGTFRVWIYASTWRSY